MKKIIFVIPLLFSGLAFGQESYPTNVGINGLEKNILFNAQKNYTVTQSGAATFDLGQLFDGNYAPYYTSASPSENDPTIITVEGLPNIHIQKGAWVGWSTRYWPSSHFKVEGYNLYPSPTNSSYPPQNSWFTIAEETNYTKSDFIFKVPFSSLGKIRFTFYNGTGTNGRLGVSELFYIHPEAGHAYDGLVPNFDSNMNLVLGSKTTTNTNTRGDLAIFARTSEDDKASLRIGYDEASNLEIYRDKAFADIHFKTNQTNTGHMRFATNNADITFKGKKFGVGTENTDGLWQSHAVFSNSGNTGISIESTNSNNSTLSFIDTRSGNPGYDSGGSIIYEHSNDNLIFRSNGIEQFRVSSNGYIGIGTNNPSTKLTVNGKINAYDDIQTQGASKLKKYLLFDNDGDFTGGNYYTMEDSNDGNFRLGYGFGNHFIMNTSGSIGIGTSTIPSDFKLAIAGKTLTEKVIVRKQENWNWPDFVFEEGYKLPELFYIKDFINKNHHLPEMPSAKEVQENGLDLDEMNRLLLKKVEELTLYLLLQDKKIKELETSNLRILLLEERINSLTKQ